MCWRRYSNEQKLYPLDGYILVGGKDKKIIEREKERGRERVIFVINAMKKNVSGKKLMSVCVCVCVCVWWNFQ